MTATYTDDDEVGEETERRPHRRRLTVVLVLSAVLVVALVSWLVAFSSVFGVRTVAVRGTSVLSTAAVRAAAKIVHGTPLVRVDTATVTRRVEGLPDVASAQVSTSFPATVTIVVVERRPVAYLPVRGGATLVDRTGAGYRTVAVPPAGLPRLDGPVSRSTGAALAAVAAALPAGVRAQVRSIQALDPSSITLLLRGNRLVRWGSAARTADKARVLSFLLRGKDDQIDVTDPDQPFTH